MDSILIGCGQIACTHLLALNRLGHSVSWVVGRDLKRTEAFAREFGIAYATTDLNEALSSDARVVHVCTPPTNHYQTICACLDAGKHVVSEKPLCISVQEAETLSRRAAETDRITVLCCNVRCYPANVEAARRIRSGEIGRPLIVSGSYLQEFHAPPHDDGWRFDPTQSGNQRAISEIGTHWIDLAYAWTGTRIVAVCAALGNWYPVRYRKGGRLSAVPEGEPVRVETEDAAAIALRFADGAIGTLMLSELSRGHFNDLSIEVNGTGGTLRWDECAPNALLRSEGASMQPQTVSETDREHTFDALFASVYAAIDGTPHDPFPTFEDGAYIARVCDAIRKSGVTGEWVEV